MEQTNDRLNIHLDDESLKTLRYEVKNTEKYKRLSDEAKATIIHTVDNKFSLSIDDLEKIRSVTMFSEEEIDTRIFSVVDLTLDCADCTKDRVWATYASSTDQTFVMVSTIRNGYEVQELCIGFYFGGPDEKLTKEMYETVSPGYAMYEHGDIMEVEEYPNEVSVE